jgi:hypothetical protein
MQKKIDSFHAQAVGFLGPEATQEFDDYESSSSDSDSKSDDRPMYFIEDSPEWTPETICLMFPSTYGRAARGRLAMESVTEAEIQLRIGQANDALQGIRMEIGRKSFLFLNTLRVAKSKTRKTRAWDSIHKVNDSIYYHRKVYNVARKALQALDADPDILSKFKVLKPEDLEASTVISEPNARGQRNKSLAWFWSMDVQADTQDNQLMTECEQHPSVICYSGWH